jgi:hypothetical protein
MAVRLMIPPFASSGLGLKVTGLMLLLARRQAPNGSLNTALRFLPEPVKGCVCLLLLCKSFDLRSKKEFKVTLARHCACSLNSFFDLRSKPKVGSGSCPSVTGLMLQTAVGLMVPSLAGSGLGLKP